jgi:hypothetical protein
MGNLSDIMVRGKNAQNNANDRAPGQGLTQAKLAVGWPKIDVVGLGCAEDGEAAHRSLGL